MYFHHPNKRKTGKKSGFTKQKKPVKIKDNLQAVQNKTNMGMLTTSSKCSVANDTLSGN